MQTTQQIGVDLPRDMVEIVKSKVSSGEYATESDVICEGLRVLFDRDLAVEDWLRAEVAAAYDDLRAKPEEAVSAGHVRLALKQAHLNRLS